MVLKQVAEIVGESNCLSEGLETYAVGGLVPKLVVSPENVEQVSALLKLADQERWTIIPHGSGTKQDLGNIPRSADIVLSLKKLNKIVEYEPDDLTATVQAGITLRDFQKCLEKKNQFFPLDPPFSSEATLGGIVATNSNGPSRYAHGSVRDLVVGIQVVHPGGAITRAGGKVVKNVSGYDMNKLYVGSLGTLGVITEFNLKLRPLPEVGKTLLLCFPSISEATQVVFQVSTSELLPTALEILDSQAWERLRVDTRLNLKSHSKEAVIFALKVEGLSENIERQIIQILEWGRGKGSIGTEVLEGTAHHTFWQKIQDHPQILPAGSPDVIRCKASILASKVGDFYRRIKEIGSRHSLDPIVLSHSGSGIVYIYFLSEVVPVDASLATNLSNSILEMRNIALQLEGSLIIEAAPTDFKKTMDVWGSTGDGFKIMKLLKERFDAREILNPGRFVGGI
jgi:FAD/FMN-containing dehydrogenase